VIAMTANTITAHTMIYIEDGDTGEVHEAAWSDFAADNGEDPDTLAEVFAGLQQIGAATIGGGAAGLYLVSLA
jgi:hypothetical protein